MVAFWSFGGGGFWLSSSRFFWGFFGMTNDGQGHREYKADEKELLEASQLHPWLSSENVSWKRKSKKWKRFNIHIKFFREFYTPWELKARTRFGFWRPNLETFQKVFSLFFTIQKFFCLKQNWTRTAFSNSSRSSALDPGCLSRESATDLWGRCPLVRALPSHGVCAIIIIDFLR